MTEAEAVISTRVKTLVPFVGIAAHTEGVIDEDYGSGIMVAWDLPHRPLPAGYCRHDGRPAALSSILRDGFDKETELHYLKRVDDAAAPPS